MFSNSTPGPFFSRTRRVPAPISRSQSTSALIRRSSPCCSSCAIHCRISKKPIPYSLSHQPLRHTAKLDNGINSRNSRTWQWASRSRTPGATMTASEIFDLHGKLALVPGASSAPGVRFAECLAENGAAVVLVARLANRLADLKARIEKSGARALAVEADVRDRAAMAAAFDAAEKNFGTVTILVNNAGVAHAGRAVDMPEEEWRRVLSTNLDAVFYCSQEAARGMLAAGKGGAIVNIASVLGLGVAKGVVAYATAKAGVIQMTKALALELAFKGIRVNAVAPGWIVTELNRDYLMSEQGQALKREIPIGRFGEERDLDGPLLLLVSDAGRFVTGTTIVADGGQVVALRG